MTDDRATVVLRLVALSAGDSCIVLDAVVHGLHEEVGSPVALVLARPDTVWFDGFVRDLLDGWATRSQAVTLQVKHGRRGRAAVLQEPTGPSTLQLDLVAVA
jgi:hypothetical protein